MTDEVMRHGGWRHELKNQLGVILGFSELLLDEMDAADVHRADIREIHAAAQRAIEVLDRLAACGDAGTR